MVGLWVKGWIVWQICNEIGMGIEKWEQRNGSKEWEQRNGNKGGMGTESEESDFEISN